MSDMKNERVANSQWKKATLWASAVVLVLVLGMAVLLIFTPKKESGPVAGSPAPSTGAATTPPAEEGCNVPVEDTSSTPKMPDDLRWEAKDGWTWPVSDTYGPTQREGEFGVCYTRTAMGAALMMVNANTAMNTVGFKEAVKQYILDSPGRDVLLAKPDESNEPISYSGFIVDSFTPDNAQVTLVFSTPDTSTGFTGLPLSFRWVDGDWKQVLLDDGSMFRGQAIEPQRGDFVEWTGTNG